MRKDELGRAAAHTVVHVARRPGAAGVRWFRPRPLVPDAAFQDADEPYPGHWRRSPQAWPPGRHPSPAALRAAVDELPDTWREVLLRHDAAGDDDGRVAAELGLTAAQERDVLARARAAVRDRLDAGAWPEDAP